MSAHVSFIANQVKVFFPFEPYEVQRQYVGKVIEALNGKHNALLESPTGTGKTLSLICSTLAWLQSSNVKSTVYYTSRTHLQLSQAAKEMKRTAYSKIPAVVIGSRSKMCLNDDVKRQPEHLINRSCRNAIAKNACAFHQNYEQKLTSINPDDVHDIEDLRSYGRSHQFCPYYAAKKIAETKASVVFMPYNYLLDGALRKTTQLKLEQSVLIFDEAHNIESSLKDCVSGLFSLKGLDSVHLSCQNIPSKLSDALNRELHGLSRSGYDPSDKNNGVVDEFAKKKNGKSDKEVKVNPIEELSHILTTDRLRQVDQCVRALKEETLKYMDMDKPGSIDKFFYILKKCGVDYGTSHTIIETLDSMSSFWSIAGVMRPETVASYVIAISQLSNVISLLYPENCLSLMQQQNNEKNLKRFYACFLKATARESTRVVKEGNVTDWELHLWCLHPAIGLKKVIEGRCINGPRSIIITSGTLAPTQAIIKELEMNFAIMHEFGHVISKNQLKIFNIDKSPNNYSLLSKYENSQKDEYPKALGETLVPLFQVLPYGTLVIMPSYAMLDRVMKFWTHKSKIWTDMNNATNIYIESRTQDKFEKDLNDFKIKISSAGQKRRAVFFGVCRGKLSEGTNLEGDFCRSVIITGMPYPNQTDERVKSTQTFQVKHAKESNQPDADSAGSGWYRNQMLKALNQTIGRVIRSRTDFGLLFLLDPRFISYRHLLSKWVWDFYPREYSLVGKIQDEIKNFFKNHGIVITESAAENCGAFALDLRDPRFWQDQSFSENSTISSHKSSQQTNPSQKTSGENDNQQSSIKTPLTAQQRQAAMVASYTVDREAIAAAKSKVRDLSSEAENSVQMAKKKRKMTTTECFNSIFKPSGESKRRVSQSDDQSNNQTSRLSDGPVDGQSMDTTESVSITQFINQTDVQSIPMSITSSTSDHNLSETTGASTSQASIFREQGNETKKSGKYLCQLCKYETDSAYRTNCRCARVACRRCMLRVLDKTKCAKCFMDLYFSKMIALQFDSAVGKERAPCKVENEGKAPKKVINPFKRR